MKSQETSYNTVSEDFFMLAKNEGGYILEWKPEDDYLHPVQNAKLAGDSLTETQYLGISIPEENIHGLMYCWHRPNLNIITGGVWIWQGIKKHHLACEIHDLRSFMHDRPLANDLHHFRFDNGYGVEVLEPMKKLHATYADPARDNYVDVEYSALMPAVKFADGMHFEQAMKTSGKLVLRGKEYEVNGYNIRDRSWGALRPEDNYPLPPVSWMTCAFNDSFFFNIIAFDHPDLDPHWKDDFNLPAEKALKSGWIYRDGKLKEVKTCRKKTEHCPETWFPIKVTMELIDDEGEMYCLKADVIAASNWSAWLNSDVVICLARWEYEGMVGHGDIQEARWTDYIRTYLK